MDIKSIVIFMRIVNLITGIGLIVLSIGSIINVVSWDFFRFFLIPAPIFIGLFGFILLCAELRIKFVMRRFQFLNSLLGRGAFNIYLSSASFWFLQEKEALAYTAGLILFFTGILYFILYFCWGKQIKQLMEKENKKKDKQQESQNKKNPLIDQNTTD